VGSRGVLTDCPGSLGRVVPTSANGYGNALTELVQSTIAAVWLGRGLQCATARECDAVALATAGADRLGWPGPDSTAAAPLTPAAPPPVAASRPT
jgi:hypothetical protein